MFPSNEFIRRTTVQGQQLPSAFAMLWFIIWPPGRKSWNNLVDRSHALDKKKEYISEEEYQAKIKSLDDDEIFYRKVLANDPIELGSMLRALAVEREALEKVRKRRSQSVDS